MYKQTQYTKYFANVDYYTLNNGNYVLLVAGTDYNIGDTITGTVYNKFEYDRLYIPEDKLYVSNSILLNFIGG